MGSDVFLSHNSKDKPAIEQIARLLTSEYQVSCWLDKWNLVPGEPWQEALEEALENCKIVAVFVGPNAISPWANEEMRAALEMRAHDKDRRVIPVLLPGAPDRGELKLPRFLSRLTWVDFRAGLDDKDALYLLYCGIQGIEPGEGEGQQEEGSAKWFTILRRKIRNFRRTRYACVLSILILILFFTLIWLGIIDVPVFCGEKYSTASGLVNLAAEQRDNGRYACALNNLQIASELEATPFERSRINYTFASIYIVKKNPARALEYSELGLEQGDNSNDLLHLSKGIAHCMMQQNREAIQEFDTFLNLTPDSDGLLAEGVRKVLKDLEAGEDRSDVCLIELGTALMP